MTRKRIITAMVVLSMLLTALAWGNSTATFNAMIIEVNEEIPDSLFESFGTRSAQFQYFLLNNDRQGPTTLIVKGWLFAPEEVIHDKIGTIIVSGRGYDLLRDIELIRDGIYLRLKPHLFVLPANVSHLSLFGLQLVLIEQEEEVFMDFEVITASRTPRMFSEGMEVFRKVDEEVLQERRFVVGENVLIGIFGGEKPTGGYSIDVDSVRREGYEIHVNATLRMPGRDAFVTQAFTYPAKIISVPLEVEPGNYRIVIELSSVRDGEILSTNQYTSSISVSVPSE